MLYLPLLKLAILLIPKCGSKWVLTTVREMGVGKRVRRARARHCRSNRSHGLLEHHSFPSGTRFAAFVRHPKTWYPSWWAFNRTQLLHRPSLQRRDRKRKAASRGWHPARYTVPMFRRDFDETARQFMEHQPAYLTRLYEWFAGPEGAERVDFIGRQEHLAEHFRLILRACGYQGDFPTEWRVNISASEHVEWQPNTLARMLALEAAAIRRFYEGETSVRV